MPAYTTEDIRNIAFTGQAGAGKTSLVEALLLEAGVIHHQGLVEKGDTASDFTDEEKKYNYSIFSSIMHADVNGTHVNIIDTPGMPDFIGQAISALPAVEIMAAVINAQVGVESVTRRLMQYAEQRNLPRMIIINRIDAENIDLPTLLENIQATFGSQCLPINVPVNNATAVADCFFSEGGDSDLGPIADAHTAIVDQVVEVDDDLAMAYLDGQEVTTQQLHDAFEKALREGHVIPICFTSARSHRNGNKPIGVKELLEVIVKLGPNPREGNPRPFIRGNDVENVIHPQPDADKHMLAHVFKVAIDPFVGKLSIFRVHQGRITRDTQIYVGDPKHGESRKPFKIAHLFKVQGKDHVEVDAAIPGDIAAVAKIDEIHFDCVLHDSHDEDNIHLLPLDFPDPLSSLAVTPAKRGDEQKLADALHKLQEEDPTCRVTRDSSTKETIISGLGELHLRIMLERLKERYHVSVDTKPPKIAYRETISIKAEGHHRHKKQTGGAGQFGEVYLRVEPRERGAGFEYADDTFGGSIPNQFIPAIEKGIKQAMENGAIAGYPIQDIKVSVYDGKHHPVDSKEIAFVTAGKKAFLDAFFKARPVLLEPLVNIEVSVPNQFMGDITGDLSGKRGQIQGTDMLPGDMAVIKALVPLSEVSNYQSQLNSVTGGQGSFTMTLSHYDPMPANVQQQIVAQYKPKAEED